MNTTIIAPTGPAYHTPSFRVAQTPPGWAVCIFCGRLIGAAQLGVETCSSAQRQAA